MPSLLNSAVGLKGTTGTNTYFIQLSGAQPALGRTPTTTTGYTLISTGVNGLLSFTSTLGGVYFNNGIVQSQNTNTDLTLQSTGTGALNLLGNVYISGTTATFHDLTITGNLTATGQTVVISPTNTGSIDNIAIGIKTPAVGSFTNLTVQSEFVSNYFTATIGNIGILVNSTLTSNYASISTATINSTLNVNGETFIEPNNANVTLSPGGTGKLYINSGGVGYLDRLIIGLNSPQAGFFTNLTVDNLTLNQTLNISTASFVNLTATELSIADLTTTRGLQVTGVATITTVISSGTISGSALYDNSNRVLTNIQIPNGNGVTGTVTISGSTATLHLSNTGVTSMIAGTDTAINTSTGVVTIWNTSTLETVTQRGAVTDQVIQLTNTSASNSTSTGALVVAGGVGIGGDVNIHGNYYGAGGSPYYSNLIYTPNVTISISPPAGPRIGDFWIDPSIGVEYQYVPNGSGAIWIQFIGF